MAVSLFPPTSTNLIVGSSNCGKTHFLKHIVQNFDLYFPHAVPPLPSLASAGSASAGDDDDDGDGGGGGTEDEAYESRQIPVVVVHCNPKTPRWPVPPSDQEEEEETTAAAEGLPPLPPPFPRVPPYLKLVQLDIDEFDGDLLEENSLVIFDDCSTLHASILNTVNVLSHHTPLLATFVASQSIVGNVHYSLSKLVHRVIFCCSTSNALDAANTILRRQVSDPELRARLQGIAAFCHREKTKFLLELNNLAAHPTTFHGFSHLDNLRPPFPHFLAYQILPPTWRKKMSVDAERLSEMDVDAADDATGGRSDREVFEQLLKNRDALPENTMIVLPVDCLDLELTRDKAAAAEEAAAKGTRGKCLTPEAVWEDVLQLIHADIDLAFRPDKWREAKSLAQYIMINPKLCVSRDGKFMWLNHPADANGAGSGGKVKRRRRLRRIGKRLRKRTDWAGVPTLGGPKLNLLNFIKAVNRTALPQEQRNAAQWKQYRPVVAALLERGTPDFLIKNKLCLHKYRAPKEKPDHLAARRYG